MSEKIDLIAKQWRLLFYAEAKYQFENQQIDKPTLRQCQRIGLTFVARCADFSDYQRRVDLFIVNRVKVASINYIVHIENASQ